jgi:KOW motif
MIEPCPGDHVRVTQGHYTGLAGIVQDTIKTTARPFVTVNFFDASGMLSPTRDVVPAAYCRVTLMGQKRTSASGVNAAEAVGSPVSVLCHGSGGGPSLPRARVGNVQSPTDRGATRHEVDPATDA